MGPLLPEAAFTTLAQPKDSIVCLTRGERGNAAIENEISIGCPVQIKESYFVKCLNSLNRLKKCPLGNVDLIWEWWYRDTESFT